MSEAPICPRCGYVNPEKARYCAQCGRALIPAWVRLEAKLEPLWRLPALYISLTAIVALGLLAGSLINDSVLFTPFSYILLTGVLGLGSLYLGWQWTAPPTNHQRLLHTTLAAIAMGVMLLLLLALDRAVMEWLTFTGQRLVVNIPGIQIETYQGVAHVAIADMPPYSLFACLFAALTALIGHALHTMTASRLVHN